MLYTNGRDFLNKNGFSKLEKTLKNWDDKKGTKKFEKQMIKGGYTGDFN